MYDSRSEQHVEQTPLPARKSTRIASLAAKQKMSIVEEMSSNYF